MRGVDDLTSYFMEILVHKEKSIPLEDTLYVGAVEAMRHFPKYADFDEENDDLPEKIISAIKNYCLISINTTSIDTAKNLHKLIETLVEWGKRPESVSAVEIAEAAELAKTACIAHLHTAEIVKRSLGLIDYDHIAEMGLETGRKRALEAAKTE